MEWFRSGWWRWRGWWGGFVCSNVQLNARAQCSSLRFVKPSRTSPFLIIVKQAKKCNEAALSLLVCMEKTPCVMSKKKSLEECMKDPIESDPCLAVRNAYYNCKHSQLNMRTRIRGVRQY